MTLGSNQSDAVPKAAVQAMMDAFQKANPGSTVKINTVDHNTFQENINTYLQGTPGRRLHLVRRLPDAVLRRARAWSATSATSGQDLDGMSRRASRRPPPATTASSTSCRSTYYPWAVFYRKSVFAEDGYQPPKTLDELKTLGAQMKKDGLVPIAFGDKDGWPAMGTFDQLNMRINGYDFHISLMAGKEAWDGDKVKKVFDTWAGLLALHQPDSLGRTWQEAAQALQQKKAGMYLLGAFVGPAVPEGCRAGRPRLLHLPGGRHAIGADAIEAPIDGYMMAKRPKNEAGGQEAARVPRLGRRAEPRGQGRPQRHRRQRHGRPARLHRPAEEVGRVRRSRPSRSRSSSTATPAPTSPRR